MGPILEHPELFGFCRAIGHSWSRGWTLTRETGAITLRLRCNHCGSERHDTIAPRSGELIARSYSYADGYLATGGYGDRSEYRREYVGWLLEQPATPDGNVVDLRRHRRRAS